MAKKPTTAAQAAPAATTGAAATAQDAGAVPAAAASAIAPANDAAGIVASADLSGQVLVQLMELAAERGISPEEILAFARDLLGGSAETIQLIAEPALPIDLPEGMELITVIGPASGLRRAGHLFNAVPNTIAVTAEQKALIAADPALSITDDPSAEAELAGRLGEKPAASAFLFDPNGFTDVKVLGPRAGRRRIGHSFGPEESIVRVDRDELEELLADTLLAVGQA